MVDKEKRDPRINGNRYHVTIAQSKRRQRVSVYKHQYRFSNYNRRDPITTNVEWKGSVLWIGADQSSPVEQLVRETLNKAVCIRENKMEEQDEYESRIDDAIENVSEVHE